jgi:hypothetical protein
MTHKSKQDRCVWAGIVLATAALFLHLGYWIAGPVLLILLLCAYPQSYETGARELVIHDSVTRRRIPYEAMTAVRRNGHRVRICYGAASAIVIAPADARAFVRALAAFTPQLVRRGEDLVLRDRYVAYSFAAPPAAFRIS